MASSSLKVTVPFGKLGPLMLQLGKRAEGAYQRGLQSAAQRSKVILNGATEVAKVMNTGNYRRSWKVDRIPNGVHIYNLAPYAGVIEYGRRAGAKMPPAPPRSKEDPIARWAQRKFGIPYKQAQRLSYPIRRAIARRGLPARKVLTGPDTVAFLVACLRDEVTNEILKTMRTSP